LRVSSIGKESFSSVIEARFLLDTNALVYLAERLSLPLVRRAEECNPGDLATSSIAYAEFARGVDWSRPHATATAARFFEAVAVLPFDHQAARIYADLPFKRHRFDRLIAAHALALDLTLITANTRDFGDIRGLTVQDWTQ
jgi:tRNA(fMet)-specific endonuclease VapC